jgi:Ca2+-binding RTX toxin-like protein
VAQPCTVPDSHGHDTNPGCDLDPRPSTPVHLGEDLAGLFNAHPNVIAYVAGHTHENKVLACGSAEGCPGGANWWEVNTSAGSADWPQQSRLIELMDNRDGTLSLFGTLTDLADPKALPAHGMVADGFGNDELASISHAVAFNDPQVGDGQGEGAPEDQNVELLVDDPRTAAIRGTAGDDVIRGTPGRDVIRCGAGDDVVFSGDGNDVIYCGPGNDIVKSGRGHDRVYGQSGRDRLFGGPGRDRLFGGTGPDMIFGQSGNDRAFGGPGWDSVYGQGGRDRLRGGSGRDRMFGGPGADRLRGGSGRDRLAGRRGNDRLFGNGGRDRLFGGPGRDFRRQ